MTTPSSAPANGNISQALPVALAPVPAAVGDAQESNIHLPEINPHPHQPRKEFDPERGEELKASLREHGQINAIIVYRDPATGRYRIIAGERRYRAAKALGWTTIRARVLKEPPDEAKCRLLMMVDNDSRTDLSDIERGVSYGEIITLTGCSARELAQKVGRNVSTVTRAIKRAQELSAYLRERVQVGTLPPSIAQELLALPGDDARHAIARQYPDPLKSRAEVITAVRAAKIGHTPSATSGFSCEECGIKIAISWNDTADAQALAHVENALRIVLKDLAGQKHRGVAHWKIFLDKKAKAARKQSELKAAQDALAGLSNPETSVTSQATK